MAGGTTRPWLELQLSLGLLWAVHELEEATGKLCAHSQKKGREFLPSAPTGGETLLEGT